MQKNKNFIKAETGKKILNEELVQTFMIPQDLEIKKE